MRRQSRSELRPISEQAKLEDYVLRLRAVEPDDARFLHELTDDPKTWVLLKTMPYEPAPLAHRLADAGAGLGKGISFLIELKTGERAGHLGFYPSGSSVAGLGIVLAPSLRGKGIGRRALQLAKQYAFLHRSWRRLWIHTLAINEPMQRLAESVGFVFEGVERSGSWVLGQHRDVHCFGLTRIMFEGRGTIPRWQSVASTAIPRPLSQLRGPRLLEDDVDKVQRWSKEWIN